MSCEQIEELLPQFLDGELLGDAQRLVEDHLETCASCRAMLFALRRVGALAATWPVLPTEMYPYLPIIDQGVRRGIRRARLIGPAFLVMRRTLGLAVSAAMILLIAGLGLGLLVMGAQLEPARQTLTSAPSTVAGPLLDHLRAITESATPPADELGRYARRIAGGVVRITVSDYRGVSTRTISNPAVIQPVVSALGTAHYVRRDRALDRAVASQTYRVELGLRDGSSLTLIYLPGEQGPNVEEPSSADWWTARGLDAAMQPLLPYPGQIFSAWRILRDDVIAAPYGWRPIGSYPDRWPQFSPDGSRLAYLPVRAGVADGTNRVVIRDLGTGTIQDVTPAEGFAFSSVRWSPDAHSLVFVQSASRPDQDPTSVLWREDASGANPTVLFRRPPCAPGENGPALGIVGWSDDGRSLELAGTAFGCSQSLPVRVRLDGSVAPTAVPSPRPTPATVKLPGGTILASLVSPGGGYSFYLVDRSGEETGTPQPPSHQLELVRIDLKTGREMPIASFPADLSGSGSFFSTGGEWVACALIPRGQGGRLVAPSRIVVFRNDGTDVRTVEGEPFSLVGSRFYWADGGRAYFQALPADATSQDQGYLYQLDARAGVAQIVTTDWRILDLLAVAPDGRHVAVLRGNPKSPDLHLLTLAPLQEAARSSATPVPVTGVATAVPATPVPAARVTATPTSPVLRQLPGPATSLAADPRNPLLVYALLASNTLYRSDDGGQTWRRLPLPATTSTDRTPTADLRSAGFLIPTHDLVVAPADPSRVFVAVDHVLYGSTDGGASWTPLNAAVFAWTVADPRGQILYAWRGDTVSGWSGLDRSDDGGQTWHEVYTGAFPPSLASVPCPCSHEGISALAADPRRPSTVYAGTDFGVLRSDDGGKTWTELTSGMPPSTTRFHWTPSLTVATDGTVYTLTEVSPDATSTHAEVLRLRPGDPSWELAGGSALAAWRSDEAPLSGFKALATDPSNPARVYLATLRGLLSSDDAGATWRTVNLGAGGAVYAIAATDGTARRLYLWTSAGFLAANAPP